MEVIVVGVLSLLMAVLLAPVVVTRHGRCCGSRQIKDAVQVRSIVQALAIFANGNRDQYPLPSALDADNNTLPPENGGGAHKDTTGNILSILIFNSSISPELCVSPSECSASIKYFAEYTDQNPPLAACPEKALWDPGFTADWTAPGGGHTSYATNQTSTERRAMWGNTFIATEAVLGNRGPAGLAYTRAGTTLTSLAYSKTSNTLAIHGGKNTWEGNIAYNDNHVNFETTVAPTEITFTNAAGKTFTDILFLDEQEDTLGTNAYLGVWIKGGMKRTSFSGLVD